MSAAMYVLLGIHKCLPACPGEWECRDVAGSTRVQVNVRRSFVFSRTSDFDLPSYLAELHCGGWRPPHPCKGGFQAQQRAARCARSRAFASASRPAQESVRDQM